MVFVSLATEATCCRMMNVLRKVRTLIVESSLMGSIINVQSVMKAFILVLVLA